jgi:hypothetical protein
MKSKVILLLIIGALGFAGCNRVVTGSEESDRALAAFNAMVKADLSRKGYHDALKHWGLSLPGGGKFEWTKDMSAGPIDFAMVIPAEPFIRAGLEVDRLGGGFVFQAAGVEGGMATPDLLLRPYDVSDKRENSQGSEDALRRIFKENNRLVAYQGDLQAYRLLLGEGFEVRWTEKLGLNAADLSFIIPADPLIAAGLDPARLGGWVFKAAADTGAGNQLVESYSLAK